MGHPLNSIDYLIESWDHLKNRFSYYGFFLFLPDHPFAEVFEEHFLHWDEISGGGSMFFAIAPPPEGWLEKARNREYWRYYVANSNSSIAYDVSAVRQAAQHFHVPSEHLPTFVIFRNLFHSDSVSIDLGGLSFIETATYLHNVFLVLNNPDVQRYFNLWQLRELLDVIPKDEAKPPNELTAIVKALRNQRRLQRGKLNVGGRQLSAHHIASRVEHAESINTILLNMQQELRRLGDEVSELRHEQREGFQGVHVHLERIQVVLEETVLRIQEFREPFIVRWQTILEQDLPAHELQEERERLHNEFDAFLEGESRQLSARLQEASPPILPDIIKPYEYLLEPYSKQALATSELLWTHLSKKDLHSLVDYSVCGIGLWKSLEIEVNRTFVDALRIFNGIAQGGQASIEQMPQKKSRVEEIASFKTNNGIKESRIDISRSDDRGLLMGVELGKVGGIITNSQKNSLSDLLRGLSLAGVQPGKSDHDYLNDLGEGIKQVARVYRNSYAHIHPMRYDICKKFRTFLFDTNNDSPLLATLECKKEFQNKRLI